MSIIEWLVNFRAQYLHLPYGDQAIFVRRSLFEELGGFPEVSLAEDLFFIRSLKRKGHIAIIGVPAITSGRRYRLLGCLRTTLINQIIVCGCYFGVSPSRLLQFIGKKNFLNYAKLIDKDK